MMQNKSKNIKKVIDERFLFQSFFDMDTGAYLRTGILDEMGADTGKDPFMASFPQILDIGIMGHCLHGLSGKCQETGIQCYQSGSVKNQPNMLIEDYKALIDQAEDKVFQVALGGRGDPEMHENFEEILSYTREHDIIPNLTTSGYGLDVRKAALVKKYCGAAAVSWYKTEYTYRAIDLFQEFGVKTNIHFVLGGNSIDEAINLIERGDVLKGINRLIFLLFKPVGQGKLDNVLKADDPRVKYLFSLFGKEEITRKVGYDSCCVPGVVNYSKGIDTRSYDSCEGGRFSAYITPDIKMLPCSFDQNLKYSVDLKFNTMQEAWNSQTFERFRAQYTLRCQSCSKWEHCMGGCPLVPDIVLCMDKDNKFYDSGVII